MMMPTIMTMILEFHLGEIANMINELSEWNIERILSDFVADYSNIQPGSDAELEELTKKYVALISLQQTTYGDVFTLDNFIQAVKSKCILDYDGSGYFATSSGEVNKEVPLLCKVSYLNKMKDTYAFVVWYNK